MYVYIYKQFSHALLKDFTKYHIIMLKQIFTNGLLDFQILFLRMLVPLRQPQRPHISSNTQNARSLEPGLSEVLLANFISRTW